MEGIRMIIDFHVHTFPAAIAQRALKELSNDDRYTSHTEGTIESTREKMIEWGIDKFVILNIATKPSQHTSINNLCAKHNSEDIISFGSVFPAAESTDELRRIKSLGLKGIKFHNDYQRVYADDKCVFPIYELAQALDLIVVFHAGFDPFSPDAHHCTPKMLARINDLYPNLKIVGAHLGGLLMWDDVEEYLVGRRNVYFDTAFIKGYIEPEQATRIIKAHEKNILFGSDCPWDSSANQADFIRSLNLTTEEKEDVFYKNALRLLQIED